MKKWTSWYLALPVVAVLALITVAMMMSSPGSAVYATAGETETAVANATATAAANATATAVATTPTATATVNPNCKLSVDKTDSPDPVGEGGQITYTITVTNDGSTSSGECSDLTVIDPAPSHTDCVSATVTDDDGLSFNQTNIDNSCDDNNTEWHTSGNLGTDESVVLQMVVKLTSAAHDGNHISNQACATSTSDVGGDCSTESTTVGAAATATPTTAPTAVVVPTIPPLVIVPVPTARALPTLSPPITGSGSSGSGGPGTLALGLGIAGAALVLVSGFALVKRTR